MKFQNIKELINIMEDKNLFKIDYEDKDFKILLEKEKEDNDNKDNDDEYWVKSPTVGKFLNLKVPIKVGQRVKKGQELFIIESMKVLNNIVSPIDGIVEEINIPNSSIVEYDEKIIKLGMI